jgi:hypothetical protein
MAAGAFGGHDDGYPRGLVRVIDADLLSFIRSTIRSTWTLELLLLVRKDPARTFSQDELVRELRSTRALIGRGARDLQLAKLVDCTDDAGCRYAPAAPELEQMCARLDRTYAERPVAVINAIVQSPTDRRQSFADAFRFTKKED